ncbi:MAG TPA: tetratricopeptide repeat protein, partial [Candidatus Angelobacter sp.]|nr:tetratricopeptide repeat protein [Candidatus Angelobacter sp.]
AQRLGTDPRQAPATPFSGAMGSGSVNRQSGSVSGKIQDENGSAMKDVRVDLCNLNGAVVSSAYTDRSGSFEFSDVPSGSYSVVATAGVHEERERVEVTGWSNYVSLRLPVNGRPQDGMNGNSITVAQYRVPGKARDEYRKAHEAVEKGKLEDGQKHLEKALAICPNFADALTLRGVLELNQHNVTAAVTDLDKAIQVDGSYAMAYVVMGSALNMQSKYDEAIRSLQRGESLSPDYWQVHFELGKAHLGKAEYPEAVRELQKAQSLSSVDYPFIALLEGNAYLSMKQYPEAVAALQSYLQKDPTGEYSPQAHKMLDRAQAFVAKAEK